jgi:hypothetical protein
MADPKDSGGNRKAVGVYDRPASADRPKAMKLLVVVVAAVAVAVVLYLLF